MLLSVEETQIWLNHLRTVLKNRKRGAAKAAATRRLKKASQITQTPASTAHPNVSVTTSCTATHPTNANSSLVAQNGALAISTAACPQPSLHTGESGAPCTAHQPSTDYCGTCGTDYEGSSQPDFWIGCDLCNKWYCCLCEGLTEEPATEYYMCIKCRK